MTFPQIPLGDDGELDIDDSHQFPALRVYKPKHSFLRTNWPFLLIGLYPVLYGAYWFGANPYISLMTNLYEFDQSVNYWHLMNFIQITPYLYFLPLAIIIPGIIGIFRKRRTCVGLFLGLFGLTAGGVLWVFGLFLVALIGHTIEHHDTLTLNDRHYHLAVSTLNLDPWEHYFTIFACNNSDNDCVVDIPDSIVSFPLEKKLNLQYNTSTRRLSVYSGDNLVKILYADINDLTSES
jgi:hypothetical protein